ncbi:MAG TPA: hypothetical protein DD435_06395, partial [Cyanobacteria bacterium UBA8530]|nr:hypothetical protein [Cyanobacteria bacterium UBA8530]
MNRITLNTIFQVFARALEFVAGLLINTWLAREWGSHFFGQIGSLSSLVGICSFLCTFGSEVLLIRTIARERERARHYLLNGLSLVSKLSLFAALVLFALGTWLFPPAFFPVLALAGLQMFLGSVCLMVQATFYAFERMEFDSLASSIDRGCWLFVGAWLATRPPSLLALFAGICLCKGLKFLVGGVLFIRFILPLTEPAVVRWKEQGRILKQAIPFGLDLLFSTIYVSVDVLLLAHWSGPSEAGYYRAASMLIVPFTILAVSLNNAFLPSMSVNARSNPAELRRVCSLSARLVLLAAFPICLFTSLFAESIIFLLYGTSYAPAVLLLRFLSLVIPLRFLNNSLSTSLLACDRQNDQMKCEGLAAGFNILCNALTIPLRQEDAQTSSQGLPEGDGQGIA